MTSDLDKLSDLQVKDSVPITDEELKRRTSLHAISKGETVSLTQLDYSLKKMLIGVGWDIPGVDPAGIDVDFSVFLLDKNDQTREDSDFVFYNNMTGAEGAVQHTGDNRSGAGDGDDERIFIDLEALSFDVVKIVLVLSIYQADLRAQSLKMLQNCFVRLVNQETDQELVRYTITDTFENDLCYALVAGELVREGPLWLFHAKADQIEGGLGKIATQYGIMVTG